MSDIFDFTSALVTAYVSSHATRPDEWEGLIRTAHAAYDSVINPKAEEPAVDLRVSPAEIRKSITPDHLVSFIDGKRYKSLRRHLNKHGLTPEQYRAKYGLGYDYPMVSASYSAARSDLAKASGLGQTRKLRAVA